MKSAVLSTNMSVFILKTGRKSLIFIGFPRDIGCQFRCQFTECRARCLNSFQAAMYIAVHGGLDVRMARNRLQSFDIRARRLHYGEIGSGVAREVLEALLDKYMNTGIYEIEKTEILKLDPFLKLGKPAKIAGYFGGKAGYLQAVRELEQAIYADEVG